MQLTRREAVHLGLGAGVALLLPDLAAPAQSGSLLERAIPSSGERIPIVGIGTARRYNVGSSVAERAPLKAVLRLFAALGGTVIDTAPSYGTAEDVVGDLVAELGLRDRLFLATKVRQRGREAGIAEMIRSAERLRTETIDLIAVHNMVDTDIELANLRDWKAAGHIRYIGMTTSSDRQHDAFAQKIGQETLDVIQVNYSLDRRHAAERILPVAADRGIAVMINLPYGRGRLFRAVGDRPVPDWATEFDCASWGQFFLKYIVSHPAVTCVIPGTAKVAYVADNLGAARGRLPDARQRRRMEQFIDAL